MTELPTTDLRTCPDCGGILEPTRPEWARTIDYVIDAEPMTEDTALWKCLLCGYHTRDSIDHNGGAIE